MSPDDGKGGRGPHEGEGHPGAPGRRNHLDDVERSARVEPKDTTKRRWCLPQEDSQSKKAKNEDEAMEIESVEDGGKVDDERKPSEERARGTGGCLFDSTSGDFGARIRKDGEEERLDLMEQIGIYVHDHHETTDFRAKAARAPLGHPRAITEFRNGGTLCARRPESRPQETWPLMEEQSVKSWSLAPRSIVSSSTEAELGPVAAEGIVLLRRCGLESLMQAASRKERIQTKLLWIQAAVRDGNITLTKIQEEAIQQTS